MKIGDTVTFLYYGGSNWGGERHVKITEETAKTWGGVEIATGGYKKYFKTKMKNIKVVPDSFEEARLELEKFLNKNSYFGSALLSDMVKEFNIKWKVDYQLKDNKLVENLKTLSKKVTFNAEQDIKTGVTIIKIAPHLVIKIEKGGYLFVNDVYYTKLAYVPGSMV